jgi:hypothetical protein
MNPKIYIVLLVFIISQFSVSGGKKESSKLDGIIIMEAESTKSDLGKWKVIRENDPNYVVEARGGAHIEFTGNGINGGKADSPLEYTFTAPSDGVYQLLIRCRKRLEGTMSDKCNDGWIRMEGDFDTGNDIPAADLMKDEKFFGGEAERWGWGSQLDWQGHIKRDALYKLKKGKKYTIVMSGRSIRWNVDYLVMFNTSKYSVQQAIGIVDPVTVAREKKIKENIVVMEAESTTSDLGKWILIKRVNENYVSGASGVGQLEFTGNGINGGNADSPLEYSFTAPSDGVYQLMIRCRKRLEGEKGDKCNDGWVKLEGDFETANDVPTGDLKKNEKIFGGDEDKWGWATQLDWQGHIKREALYKLKKGVKYTITLSGRSIRWSVDYLVMYNTTNYAKQEVLDIIDPTYGKKAAPVLGWNTEVKGFVNCYFDKPNKAFAINTTEVPTDKWSAVNKKFEGESGMYTITFTSLLETDGECMYKVVVDGKTVLEVANPRIFGTDKREYSPHKVSVNNVELKKESLLQVEFISNSNNLVKEGSGFGYARARWQDLEIVKQ